MNYTLGSTVLGSWTITHQLGKGSFGQVFEVQKKDYGITTTSALKVIHIPPSQEDIETALSEGMDEKSVTSYFQGFVDKIAKEISIMSTLKSHPNIVAYEDHSVLSYTDPIGWDILIRMELLIPLRNLQRQTALSEKEARQLGIDICKALTFCHKKGILHRDIKPANIFVSEAGQYKLGDFGVARSMEAATQGMSKAGTENYMAPEVHRCEPSYGSNVDLYSLGMVLYQLMNHNRLPFLPPAPAPIRFTDRENALQQRMQGQNFPAPSQASKEFSEIILKACAYDPQKRYQTAEEMLKALENLKPSMQSQPPVNAMTTFENTIETIPSITLNISSSVPYADGLNALKEDGNAELWITKSYAEHVLSDKIPDAALRVSWTNGLTLRFSGSFLKQLLRESLHVYNTNTAPYLMVYSHFPPTPERKLLTIVHIQETSDSELPFAYLNGVLGTLYYIGTDNKTYLQTNMHSSAIYNKTPQGQVRNPFYHIHSRFEIRPKRLRITSALAECGGRIPLSLPGGQHSFLSISSHSQNTCPKFLPAHVELVSGKTFPMLPYTIEEIIPHDKIACWFPDEQLALVAPDPQSAQYELFDPITCNDFYHYLEHGYDRVPQDQDGATEATLSIFSSKKILPENKLSQIFEKNRCPILSQQLFPGGTIKEQIRTSENKGKAEVWVTRTFAENVVQGTVADLAIHVHLTNGLYWSLSGGTLLYYMRELLHYGEILARRFYPFINKYREDILFHLVDNSDESVSLAALDGVHNIVRYLGTGKKWHMSYNTMEIFSAHTSSTSNKNPFHGLQSCIYKPEEKTSSFAT